MASSACDRRRQGRPSLPSVRALLRRTAVATTKDDGRARGGRRQSRDGERGVRKGISRPSPLAIATGSGSAYWSEERFPFEGAAS